MEDQLSSSRGHPQERITDTGEAFPEGIREIFFQIVSDELSTLGKNFAANYGNTLSYQSLTQAIDSAILRFEKIDQQVSAADVEKTAFRQKINATLVSSALAIVGDTILEASEWKGSKDCLRRLNDAIRVYSFLNEKCASGIAAAKENPTFGAFPYYIEHGVISLAIEMVSHSDDAKKFGFKEWLDDIRSFRATAIESGLTPNFDKLSLSRDDPKITFAPLFAVFYAPSFPLRDSLRDPEHVIQSFNAYRSFFKECINMDYDPFPVSDWLTILEEKLTASEIPDSERQPWRSALLRANTDT